MESSLLKVTISQILNLAPKIPRQGKMAVTTPNHNMPTQMRSSYSSHMTKSQATQEDF